MREEKGESKLSSAHFTTSDYIAQTYTVLRHVAELRPRQTHWNDEYNCLPYNSPPYPDTDLFTLYSQSNPKYYQSNPKYYQSNPKYYQSNPKYYQSNPKYHRLYQPGACTALLAFVSTKLYRKPQPIYTLLSSVNHHLLNVIKNINNKIATN